MEEIKITIPISPRTKKNSSRIITVKGRPMIIPSKLFVDYQKACEPFIPKIKPIIDFPINLKCVYYMPTKRKVDLNNLLEATTYMLVHHKVLKDDTSRIVYSHDGSYVDYDKTTPRTEIIITRLKQ